MRGKNFNKVKPYVYWLKNLTTGQKYFGVRWKNATKLKKTPIDDFGKIYFTSSKNLKKEFKNNPENFRYKLIYTFDTPEEARDYETKFTKKIVKDKRWINRSSWPVVIKSPEEQKKHGAYISKIMKGRIFTSDWKRKISDSKKGSKNPAFGKPSPMFGKKRSDQFKLKSSEGHKGQKAWNKGIQYSLVSRSKNLSYEKKKQLIDKLNGIKKKRIVSAETRKKLSLAFKGIKLSKERRERLKGWKQTDQAKNKISLAIKSRMKNPEVRKKTIQHLRTGAKKRIYKPLSEELKKKLSIALKGKKRPPEIGLKVSKKLKGRKRSTETKLKIAKTLRERKKKILAERRPSH